MSRLSSTLMISLAACAFSAVPAFAQSSYNGGSTYRNQQPAQASEAAKEAKRTAKAEKKLRKAMSKKEQMMKDGAMKDMKSNGSAKTYGSGTVVPAVKPTKDSMKQMKSHGSAKTYGSGTKADTMAAPMKDMKSYGSGTAAPMAKPTNCPTGTEPQNNGTCMLTSGSLPGT